MKTLKFNYSTHEYIYEIKSYIVDFSEKKLTFKIVDSKDNLFNWVKNNRDGGARSYVTDITISDKDGDVFVEYQFNECKLDKFIFLAENEECEVTVVYGGLNLGMSK